MRSIENPTRIERFAAQAVFLPKRFGFTKYGEGDPTAWQKSISYKTGAALQDRVDLGPITFFPLRSAHFQVEGLPELLDYMQNEIFGVNNPRAGIGSHFIGMPHYVVAYKDNNFSREGAVGLSVAFGDANEPGIFASKSVGVMPDYQGKANIGWYLRILQAHHAVTHDFDAMQWSFNPLLAKNASLFIKKLGGEITRFIPKKSGLLDSANFKPSDKAIVRWDLLDTKVHKRVHDVHQCIEAGVSYKGTSLEEIQNPFVVTGINVGEVGDNDTLLYEIPRDFYTLSPAEREAWETDLNIVFQTLLDADIPEHSSIVSTNPAQLTVPAQPGKYIVTDFIDGERKFYVFTRKKGTQKTRVSFI